MESNGHEHFISGGFKLFLKWVLNIIARPELKPMYIQIEGFKVRVFIVFSITEKGIIENKIWEKF